MPVHPPSSSSSDWAEITFCFEILDILTDCFYFPSPGDSAVPRGEQDRGDPVDAGRVRARRHPRPLRLLPVQTHRQRRRE